MNPSRPKITSLKTVKTLKSGIKVYNKFTFLDINGAIDSKWGNWELGYGDANRFQKNITLFPLEPGGDMSGKFKGVEYLELYPYIADSDGTERYTKGPGIM